MKKSSIICTILCITLSLLFFADYPLRVFAQTYTPSSEAVNVQSAEQKANRRVVVRELTEKRTANTKHFVRADGSYVSVVYPRNVHYLEEDGSWLEYNSRAVAEARTAAQTKRGGLIFEYGALTWQYENTNTTVSVSQERSAEKKNVFHLPDIIHETYYANIYDYVDMVVKTTPEGVKENLILKDRRAASRFVITYTLPVGMTVKQADGQTVKIYDGKGDVAYVINAPVMIDAEKNVSRALNLKIQQISKGKFSLVLEADVSWLKTAVYPVTVDPTVGEDSNGIQSVTATVANGAAYVDEDMDETYLYVGNRGASIGTARSFIRYPMPTLKATDIITYAEINFIADVIADTSFANYVYLYEVSSPWTSDMTWNGMPYTSSTLVNYIKLVQGNGQTISVDVTKQAQKWKQLSGTTDGGIMLRMATEGGTSIACMTIENSDTDLMPLLLLDYVSHSGISDEYSYQSFAAGTNGAVHTDLYTGGVIVQETLGTQSGNRLSANITMYHAPDQFTAWDTTASAGGGWRYDFQTKIEQISSATEALLYNEGYHYRYIDGDGTPHCFKQTASAGVYTDDEGLGLTLTLFNSNNGGFMGFELRSRSDDWVRFYPVSQGGKLHSRGNAAGDTLTYTYSGNKLVLITDSLGRNTEIQYTTVGFYEVVEKILFPDLRTATFTYYDGYDAAYLSRVTYSDGSITSYGYGTNCTLTRISSSLDETYLVLTYTNGKLTLAQVYNNAYNSSSTEENVGQSLAFTYGNSNTKVTDHNGNTVEYLFDAAGRPIQIINPDGTFSDATYTDGNDSATNKLKTASETIAYVNNLLTNASAENGLTGYVTTGTAGKTLVSSSKAYIGGHSFAYESANYDSGGFYTEYILPADAAETYTFSAYVLKDGLFSNSSIAIEYYNGSTLLSRKEQPINEYFASNQWRRFHVTLARPSGATKIRAVFGAISTFGNIYFDALQLESGESPGHVNLLNNSSFDAADSWAGGTIINGTCNLYGTPSLMTNTYQTVSVQKQNPAFRIYAAAQADGAPNTSPSNGVWFGVRLKFNYSDGSYSIGYKQFNSYNPNKQSVSAVLRPDNEEKTVTTVEFAVYYSMNVSTASVYEVMLCQDNSGVTYEYDEDKLVSITDNSGRKYQYIYDEQNTNYEPDEIQTVSGERFVYEYDSVFIHQIAAAYNSADKSGTHYTYDQFGNVKRTTVASYINVHSLAPSGYCIYSENIYTADGNYLSSTYDARGKQTSYTYDTNRGLLQTVTDPLGLVTSYNYNAQTRLPTSVTSNGITVSYGYDAKNRLNTVTHNGFSYDFAYDSWGDRASVSINGSPLATYTYTGKDRLLTRVTLGNGSYTSYTYDELNRTESITGSGKNVRYVYNRNGLLAQRLVDDKGYTYSYDTLGRLEQTEYDGKRTVYAYDEEDRLVSETMHYNETDLMMDDKLVRTVTYNNKGQLTAANLGDITAAYTYDTLGRPMSKSVTNSYTLNTSYTYLAGDTSRYANTMATTSLVSGVSIVHKDSTNANTTRSYTYTYDDVGNITHVYRNGILQAKYTYDALYQLVREDDAVQNKSITYTYDNGGNITARKEYAYTTGTLGTATSTVTYTYDSVWKDRLISDSKGGTYQWDGMSGTPWAYKGKICDWEGTNLTYYGTVAFDYDGEGKWISKYEVPYWHTYEYDTEGRLIGETCNDMNNGICYKITYYYNIVTNEVEGLYYDGYNENFAARGRYTYMKNLQGDVIGLVDTSGKLVVEYTYDAWGKLTSCTGIYADTLGKHNAYRYRGYIYDEETGLYYLQTRYYDPEIGRFISADGYISTGQGVLGYNMFAYCNNAPINYYDPNGTDCICLTQRVRGNHICYDHDKISFEEIYYNNTGKQYDYQVNKYENVSVVKSEKIITKTDEILKDSILIILKSFVSYASKGIIKGIGFVFGATKSMGEISSLDVGTYSTYSVTKTHYYKQAVEVANYHGYRVYQDKTFKYTVTEIYYVSNGEFAKIDIFYTDSYYAYKYRNRY